MAVLDWPGRRCWYPSTNLDRRRTDLDRSIGAGLDVALDEGRGRLFGDRSRLHGLDGCGRQPDILTRLRQPVPAVRGLPGCSVLAGEDLGARRRLVLEESRPLSAGVCSGVQLGELGADAGKGRGRHGVNISIGYISVKNLRG